MEINQNLQRQLSSDAVNKLLQTMESGTIKEEQPTTVTQIDISEAFKSTSPAELTLKLAIENLLKEYGIKPTEENIKLYQLLMNEGFNVNKEALQKAIYTLKLSGMDFEKALFFIENQIPATQKNMETLNTILNNEGKLTERLKEFLASVNELPTELEAIKNEINSIFHDKLNKFQEIKPQLTETVVVAQSKPEELMSLNKPQVEQLLLKELPRLLEGLADSTKEMPKDTSQSHLPSQKKILHGEGVNRGQEIEKPLIPAKEIIENTIKEALKPYPESLNQAQLKQVIQELVKELQQLPQLKQQPYLKEILNFPEKHIEEIIVKSQAMRPKAMPRLSIALKAAAESQKNTEAYFGELREGLAQAKEIILKANLPETTKLGAQLTEITSRLDFLSQMKTNFVMELPLITNGGKEQNAEIFVFKDKRTKKDKDGKSTALVALDTLNLGRYEVFVQKLDKKIVCQFRVADEDIEALTKEHIFKLNEALSALGYNLSNYSLKTLEAPFTLLDKPKESTGKDNNQKYIQNIEGRLSFNTTA